MMEPNEVRENAETRDDDAVADDELESASGGVIDGGCTGPFMPVPTFPHVDNASF